MQWVINKTIAVEAETPEEAVSKISEGQTISFNVTLRPEPQTGIIRTNVQGTQLPSTAQILGATKTA